jgi:hypothetical protein
MELWIRSQDKSSIVKVDNLYVSVGNYICYYVEKGKEVPGTYYRPSGELGRYETKERSLEVLDEIQRLITDLQYLNYAIKNDEFCSYRPNVYEMPEK